MKKNQDTKSSKNVTPLIVILALTPILAATPATALIMIVGMVPTLIALIMGPSIGRIFVVICVGSTNLCGIIPAVMKLWEQGGTIDDAIFTLKDPFIWLIMYASSAIGWLLVFTLPPIMGLSIRGSLNRRIRELQQQQELLVATWGDKVADPRLLYI